MVDTLRLFRPDSYLIDIARGAIVDESALTQALQAGRFHSRKLRFLRRAKLSPEPFDHQYFGLFLILINQKLGKKLVLTCEKGFWENDFTIYPRL